MYYKLDENKEVKPSSISEWSDFKKDTFPTNYLHVGDEVINNNRISTIFIGICFDFGFKNKNPLVFETLVFDKHEHTIYQKRCPTFEEAEKFHREAVQWVKDGCKDDDK